MTFRFVVAFVGICFAATPAMACDNGPFPIDFVAGTATLSKGSAKELDNSRSWLNAYLRYPARHLPLKSLISDPLNKSTKSLDQVS